MEKIQANELRIGNKILFIICDKEDSKLDEKKEITVDISDFEFIKNNNSLFEGIPLTEEWFLKLRFVNKLGGWRKGKLRLSDNLEVPVYYVYYNGAFLRTIQYVHELQNLYFALTGEELISYPHPQCDESCYYHCTKGGQQEPECESKTK